MPQPPPSTPPHPTKPAAFAALLLTLLAGCTAPAVPLAQRGAHPSVRYSAQPLPAAPLDGATTATVQHPVINRRLADDTTRSIESLGWGVLRVETSIGQRVVVHARALLPDNRTAQIVAGTRSQTSADVQVKVGRFGDGTVEQRFIEALRRTLAGPEMRKRVRGFELPEDSRK